MSTAPARLPRCPAPLCCRQSSLWEGLTSQTHMQSPEVQPVLTRLPQLLPASPQEAPALGVPKSHLLLNGQGVARVGGTSWGCWANSNPVWHPPGPGTRCRGAWGWRPIAVLPACKGSLALWLGRLRKPGEQGQDKGGSRLRPAQALGSEVKGPSRSLSPTGEDHVH